MDTLEDIILSILFFASLLVPAISVTAPLAIWWSVRSEYRRQKLPGRSNLTSASEPAPISIGLRHLTHWMPAWMLALAIVSAIGLLSSWTVAIIPVVASSYVAYRWQIALRCQRVKWPVVYATALWILPQLACTAMIIAVGQDLAYFGNPYSVPEWVWEVGYGQVIIWKTRLLVATALLAVVALVAAMVLSRLKRPPVSPNFVAALSFAHAIVFWFSNPFGFMLGTISMVLIGHAISREARAAAIEFKNAERHSDGKRGRRRVIPVVFAGLVAATTGAAVAYGISLATTDASLLDGAEYGGIPIMLSWILGVALIAFTLWAVLRGKLRQYGAVICGLSWIPISYLVYGFDGARTYQEYWLHAWSYWQMGALAIAATVMLAIMWRVFGPGETTAPTNQLSPIAPKLEHNVTEEQAIADSNIDPVAGLATPQR